LLGRLFLLFVTVPILDLALLVSVGGAIGFWPTVGIVVATAAAGSWLARREGLAAFQRVQAELARGGVPGAALIDGLLILVSGVLLLTPGFLTDALGLIGLLPPSRAALRRLLERRFERAVQEGRVRILTGMPTGFPAAPPPVEDAEVLDDGRA
jgi:UPF0716 protein FxsA